MGNGEHQISKIPCSSYNGVEKVEDHWKIMDSHDEEDNDILSLSSLDSTDGSSSSDMADDASTSSNSCSSSLYDLSELMSQLPIKRGLSKFYQGKSESFTSLSRVTSIEDLAKKQTPYRRKIIKSSKSYGGGLDTYKLYTLPKSNISKKVSRNSMISSPSFPSRRGSFVSNYRPPLIPLQKN